MFYLASVCLSVCLLAVTSRKTTDLIFIKILSEICICGRGNSHYIWEVIRNRSADRDPTPDRDWIRFC